MRRAHLALWIIALLLVSTFMSSSVDDFKGAPATRSTKIVRIALLPICNPGFSCDPGLPAELGTSFFRSSFGVANFIHDVSLGNTRIVGTTLPWLRAKKRLRNAEELVAARNHFIALADEKLKDFNIDVYVFFLNLSGSSTEAITVMRDPEHHRKAFAFLVNTPVFSKPTLAKPTSVIVPSTTWALAVLKGLGVNGATNTLNCEPNSQLHQCAVQRGKDPYSILGEMAFSLAPPSALTRAILWGEQPLKTIDTDGSYHLESTSRSANMIAIQLRTPLVLNESSQFDRLYIEQKRLSKFDRRLRSLLSKEFKSAAENILASHERGAFLYLGSSKNSVASTLLIDANPKTSGATLQGRSALLAELADTTLLPGQRFKVFETPITLEITDYTATSLTIKVAGLSQ